MPRLRWTNTADGTDGGKQQGLWSVSVIDKFDDVRPSRIQFPVAGRVDRLLLKLRVGAFQSCQYLIVKTANPAHRKHSRQHPVFVSAGIRMPDCTHVPGLRGTHRCFQDSPPYFVGSAVIEVYPLEGVLDVTKR